MALLFDADYEYLAAHDIAYIEVEAARIVVFTGFPLPEGVYVAEGKPCSAVDGLYVVPENYNTAGGDMFWTHPMPTRADGKPIPNVSGPGQDSRTHGDIEYLRWSRHWNNKPWKPKVDNVQTIIDRLTWAFAKPDAKR
jgi:hypothetical protein